jgi:hypothetical protein
MGDRFRQTLRLATAVVGVSAVVGGLGFFGVFQGCSPSAGPKQAAVSGRATYRGHPLAGGTVVFAPDADRGNAGPLARAVIEPDGTFRLHTPNGPGVLPGWYRVSVAEPPAVPAPNGVYFNASPWAYFPPHFRRPDLSGLSREVKLGQENVFELALDGP